MGIKLVILGMLMEGNKHPYEIQQLVKERQMEHYIKLAKGSLYYAFEQLEKQGYIDKEAIITDTNRPDKTIYTITKSGIELFNQLLLDQITAYQHMFRPIYSALSFGAEGNATLMAEKIKTKCNEIENLLEIMTKLYEKQYSCTNLSNTYILVSVILHLQTELTWLKQLYLDTKEGNLQKIGVPLLKSFERNIHETLVEKF